MLSRTDKALLLHTARESITAHLHGTDAAWSAASAVDLPDASGVFVTIKRRGELRGCLGVLQLRGSLADEVARCARDAATADPRFPPMTADELADISLDISVLGPLEEIDPRDESTIIVGRHGLVVEQVAVEWGWTREQFLDQTCRKAGLAADAWRRGARVFRFDADVFSE